MATLAQIKQLRSQLPPATPENINLREEMLGEVWQLLYDLERPDNMIERVGFQLVESAFVNTAIRMGLFEALVREPDSTIGELAAQCQADSTLTGRILRGLAAHGAVEAIGNERYRPNLHTSTFAQKRYQNAITATFDFLAPGWLALPQFLQDRKWSNPASPTDTPLGVAHQAAPHEDIWDIMARHPAKDAFMEAMKHHNEGHKQWTDMYPVAERLGRGAESDPSAVMMVDIGGGLGHQAIGLKERFPELPGRFIVQDLPIGLPPADQRPSGVEFMEHDFRKPQPIKGARLYYLRHVIHDWSQDFNTELCKHVREAMKPGYSKLIINEWIVPTDLPTRFMAIQDINMLNGSGGMERTEALHREYLERAGLRVTGIYYPDDKMSAAVIEAEAMN